MYKNGFLKVAAITPNIIAGNIINNRNEILKNLNETKAGVLVFPELTITGYTISDLFYQEEVITDSINALKYILDNNKNEGIAAIGLPLEVNGSLFNVAALIQKNKILGIVPKFYLPNNQEFSEKRWFLSGFDANFDEVRVLGKSVPFGNLKFIEEEKNIIIGVEICQDLWSIKAPSDDLAMAGANIILNLSASTEVVQKEEARRITVLDHSRKQSGAYIYTTTGSYESSSEAVYSSHKIIASLGNIVKESMPIDFKANKIEADLNITEINYQRRQDSNYRDSAFKNSNKYKDIYFNLNTVSEYEFYDSIDKKPFVLKNDKDKKRVYDILTIALMKKLSTLPKDNQKLVIGISGGLDSAHALIIAKSAITKLNLPLENIYPVIMPSSVSPSSNMKDAEELIKGLGLKPYIINIKEQLHKHLESINHDSIDVTYENAQARIRTLILMDLANKYKAIVLGTGDLSEIALGFMTYNGDQMSMYAINSGVPKTLMQDQMLFYAKDEYKNIKNVIERIVNKKISPDLLKDQDSEKIIGTYLVNDFIMHYHLLKGLDREKLIFLVRKAFNKELEDASTYVDRFLERFYNQQFKRSSMPEGPKVFNLSLSPRLSYRMPSDIVRK